LTIIYYSVNNRLKFYKIVISLCLLRLCILRLLWCSVCFLRAILSWCPQTWLVHIVYNIFSLNISSIYILTMQTTTETREYKWYSIHSTSLCVLCHMSQAVRDFDLSTLFTTFFLWTSPPFIFKHFDNCRIIRNCFYSQIM